jgi:hypothetical protein
MKPKIRLSTILLALCLTTLCLAHTPDAKRATTKWSAIEAKSVAPYLEPTMWSANLTREHQARLRKDPKWRDAVVTYMRGYMAAQAGNRQPPAAPNPERF